MILCTVISIAAVLMLPINRLGLFKALHYVLRDTSSAISDYRCWAEEYRVYVDVKGVFNLSQQPIQSQFEVLGISNLNSLVVYDSRAGLIYTVGTDQNANIYPQSIRCIKGEPIAVVTKKVTLKNQLLGNLINHIPESGQTFIKGTVTTLDQVILPRDPQTYETIRPSIHQLELRYVDLKQLQEVDVSTIFALSGDLYLRTILPAENKRHLSRNHFNLSFVPVSIGNNRVYTVEMYLQEVKHVSEILVSEGQYLKASDLVAKLHNNNEAALALEEDKLLKHLQQLKESGETSSLFVTAAQLRLTELRQERRQDHIYSQFNAQVLLIRVVAVHNNSLTLAIKLLVNAPQPESSDKTRPKPQIEPPKKDTDNHDPLLKATL
jgi:hypothetical protein